MDRRARAEALDGFPCGPLVVGEVPLWMQRAEEFV